MNNCLSTRQGWLEDGQKCQQNDASNINIYVVIICRKVGTLKENISSSLLCVI